MQSLAPAPHRSFVVRALPRAVRQSPVAIVAVVVIVFWIVVALTAPLIAPYPPLEQDVMNRLAPPSAAHWLGTDYLGRDILSRLLAGTRLSVLAAVEAVVIALVLVLIAIIIVTVPPFL